MPAEHGSELGPRGAGSELKSVNQFEVIRRKLHAGSFGFQMVGCNFLTLSSVGQGKAVTLEGSIFQRKGPPWHVPLPPPT
jgi:hypothetical protein